jgi:hypothetical protein
MSRPPDPRVPVGTPPLPAPPPHVPHRGDHEDPRAGALTLVAAFETRSGPVYGQCDARKRQQEGLPLLDQWDHEIAQRLTPIHRVCDHVRTPQGQEVRQGLATHPRVLGPFTPGHGAGMKPLEQGFSGLPRQRLRLVDLAATDPVIKI